MTLSPLDPNRLQSWIYNAVASQPPAPARSAAPQAITAPPAIPLGPVTHLPPAVKKFTPPAPPKNFFALPSDVQNAVYAEMKQEPKNSAAYKTIVRFATSNEFLALPPESQIAVARAIRPAIAQGHDGALKKLINSPEFVKQPAAAQAAFAAGFGSDGAGGDPIADLKRFVDRSEYRRSSPEVKAELAKGWADWPTNTDGQDRALALAADRSFKQLPADTQVKAMRAYNAPNSAIETDLDAGRRANIEKLIKSPEFAKISEKEQGRWLDALGDPDSKVRALAHERIEGVFDATKGWAEADRVKFLGRRAGAVREQEDVPATRETFEGGSKNPPQITVDKSITKSDKFIGKGKEPAIGYKVNVDGQEISVILPKKAAKGATLPTIDQIADGLARMPASARASIKEVVVEPKPAGNTLMAADHPSMGIHIFPGADALGKKEFANTLVHESGHLLAKKLGSKAGDEGWQKWIKAIESDDRWPSYYAASSLQEDVAETIALYHQVKGTAQEKVMAERFPARWKLVQELLGQ